MTLLTRYNKIVVVVDSRYYAYNLYSCSDVAIVRTQPNTPKKQT